jgi:cytosine/adenosine deaminase-related metal-dependent hydrolase
LGAAIHSVRAVPACEMAAVVSWARERGAPLHVHLSEQRAENEQCRRHQGRSPTQLLADQGVLGASTTVVHATHVTADDISLLGGAGVSVCLCPTTERELGDGLGPAGPLAESGCRLTVGSDGHFVIDGFEEARDGAGMLAPGHLADLVTVGLHSPRVAGARPETALGAVVFGATAADVDRVVVAGADVVREGRHVRLGDAGTLLDRAVGRTWEAVR